MLPPPCHSLGVPTVFPRRGPDPRHRWRLACLLPTECLRAQPRRWPCFSALWAGQACSHPQGPPLLVPSRGLLLVPGPVPVPQAPLCRAHSQCLRAQDRSLSPRAWPPSSLTRAHMGLLPCPQCHPPLLLQGQGPRLLSSVSQVHGACVRGPGCVPTQCAGSGGWESPGCQALPRGCGRGLGSSLRPTASAEGWECSQLCREHSLSTCLWGRELRGGGCGATWHLKSPWGLAGRDCPKGGVPPGSGRSFHP